MSHCFGVIVAGFGFGGSLFGLSFCFGFGGILFGLSFSVGFAFRSWIGFGFGARGLWRAGLR
jgi:hypothetical protein